MYIIDSTLSKHFKPENVKYTEKISYSYVLYPLQCPNVPLGVHACWLGKARYVYITHMCHCLQTIHAVILLTLTITLTSTLLSHINLYTGPAPEFFYISSALKRQDVTSCSATAQSLTTK